jgi:hypothetical protein
MSRWILAGLAGLAWVPLMVAPALGEPSHDEAVKMARKRFLEGVAAVDAGNYEAARIAFQQAYALKPHASVLRNLGQAELKTGHFLEAARHLSTFVRDTTYGNGVEREAAGKSLLQAEAKVGKIIIHLDVAGADVTVDGELAGRSPITDPFYAEPGERLIRIAKEGFETYARPEVIEAGRTTQLNIALEPARVPTPAASVSRIDGSLVAPPDPAPVVDAVGPPPAGLAPTVEPKGGGRTVALVATGGLTLVSAGLWIGFGLRGASLQNDADRLLAEVNATRPTEGCSKDAPPCPELRDTNDRRATANTVAVVGAVATGVSAAAFAGVFFFWPRSADPHALLGPVVAPDRAGLELRGTF